MAEYALNTIMFNLVTICSSAQLLEWEGLSSFSVS